MKPHSQTGSTRTELSETAWHIFSYMKELFGLLFKINNNRTVVMILVAQYRA